MAKNLCSLCLYLLQIVFAVPDRVLCKGVKASREQGADLFRSSYHRGILIIKSPPFFWKVSAFSLRIESLTQSQEQNKTQGSLINSTSLAYWNENSTSNFGVNTQGALHYSFARILAFRFYTGCDSGALKWSSSLSGLLSNLQLRQLLISVTCGIGAMARLCILIKKNFYLI